jgi:hypothetical protein
MIGLAVITIVGGFAWVMLSAKPDDYATRALKIKLKSLEEGREFEASDPELAAMRRSLEIAWRRGAETLPRDRAGQELVEMATLWYEEDVISIWLDCSTRVRQLSEAKPPIQADQREILEGAVEVMRRLHVRPLRDHFIREFGYLYVDYRKSAPDEPKHSHQLSHQETVNMLVKKRKFANK